MRYRLLTDVHFGDGSYADDFGRGGNKADADIVAFCQSSDAPLIIGGDLLELWQCRLPDILRAHGEALEVVMAHAECYLAGNHDREMFGTRFMGHRVQRVFSDGPFWIEHGDAYDRAIRRHPWLCATGAWLGGIAERVVSRDVDVLAERVAGWLGGTGRHGGNDPYVAHVAGTAKIQGKSIAAFGHTHEPGRWERDGRVILNAGTWTNGRRDYVLLDDSGDCTVERFQ